MDTDTIKVTTCALKFYQQRFIKTEFMYVNTGECTKYKTIRFFSLF